MASSFELNVLTAGRSLASTQATALTIPGSLGYMTILPDHTAFVSELAVGTMTVTDAATKEKKDYFLSGGFVEVVGSTVNVLADQVEKPEEIDRAAVEAEAKALREKLGGKQESAEDIDLLSHKLKEAEARLDLAK